MTDETQPQLLLVVNNEADSESATTGGYKSGRNTCRETPDTLSTVNTRSAGTLRERRHFWTAWYRTPHLEANAIRPPEDSIANSIGPGAGSISSAESLLMNGSMQPIVALGQQPIRARARRRMQLMVVRTKEQARQEFAKNLNAECTLQGAPKRGRPDWLRDRIGKIVSRESCRKWLAGDDIPDQANMSVLIEALGVNEQKLRIGHWSPPPGSHDDRLTKITRAWPSLPSKTQQAIMAVLDAAVPSEEGEQNVQTKGRQGRNR